MSTTFHQTIVVQPGGLITLAAPSLVAGQRAEVIIRLLGPDNRPAISPHVLVALQALRHALVEALGPAFDQLILFGSHARGEARPGSDIDVLIVVNGAQTHAELSARTAEAWAQICLEHEVVIERTFITQAEYQTGQTTFLQNVRQEGQPIT